MSKSKKSNVPVILIGFLVTLLLVWSTLYIKEEVHQIFTITDKEIKTYVQDTHHIDSTVLESVSLGTNLPTTGATVQAEDGTIFQTNVRGGFFFVELASIEGDNYVTSKKKKELNQAFRNSEEFQQLKEIGFTDLTFGDHTTKDYHLRVQLPEKVTETASLEKIAKAMDIIHQLNQKMTDYQIDFLTFIEDDYSAGRHELHLKVKDYKDVEEMEKGLVQDNPYHPALVLATLTDDMKAWNGMYEDTEKQKHQINTSTNEQLTMQVYMPGSDFNALYVQITGISDSGHFTGNVYAARGIYEEHINKEVLLSPQDGMIEITITDDTTLAFSPI